MEIHVLLHRDCHRGAEMERDGRRGRHSRRATSRCDRNERGSMVLCAHGGGSSHHHGTVLLAPAADSNKGQGQEGEPAHRCLRPSPVPVSYTHLTLPTSDLV